MSKNFLDGKFLNNYSSDSDSSLANLEEDAKNLSLKSKNIANNNNVSSNLQTYNNFSETSKENLNRDSQVVCKYSIDIPHKCSDYSLLSNSKNKNISLLDKINYKKNIESESTLYCSKQMLNNCNNEIQSEKLISLNSLITKNNAHKNLNSYNYINPYLLYSSSYLPDYKKTFNDPDTLSNNNYNKYYNDINNSKSFGLFNSKSNYKDLVDINKNNLLKNYQFSNSNYYYMHQNNPIINKCNSNNNQSINFNNCFKNNGTVNNVLLGHNYNTNLEKSFSNLNIDELNNIFIKNKTYKSNYPKTIDKNITINKLSSEQHKKSVFLDKKCNYNYDNKQLTTKLNTSQNEENSCFLMLFEKEENILFQNLTSCEHEKTYRKYLEGITCISRIIKIYEKIKSNFINIMCDKKGNYFIQDLVKKLPVSIRIELWTYFNNHSLISILCTKRNFSNYCLQSMIKIAKDDNEQLIILNIIFNHFYDLLNDKHGVHIISSVIECFSYNSLTYNLISLNHSHTNFEYNNNNSNLKNQSKIMVNNYNIIKNINNNNNNNIYISNSEFISFFSFILNNVLTLSTNNFGVRIIKKYIDRITENDISNNSLLLNKRHNFIYTITNLHSIKNFIYDKSAHYMMLKLCDKYKFFDNYYHVVNYIKDNIVTIYKDKYSFRILKRHIDNNDENMFNIIAKSINTISIWEISKQSYLHDKKEFFKQFIEKSLNLNNNYSYIILVSIINKLLSSKCISEETTQYYCNLIIFCKKIFN